MYYDFIEGVCSAVKVDWMLPDEDAKVRFHLQLCE